MGYNLAIEYLADPEKTWMLDSFKQLDNRVLQPQHRALKEWLFLTVRVRPCFPRPPSPPLPLGALYLHLHFLPPPAPFNSQQRTACAFQHVDWLVLGTSCLVSLDICIKSIKVWQKKHTYHDVW